MFKGKKYLIGLVVLAVVAMVGTVALAQTGEQIISNVLSATVNSRYEKPVLLTWAVGAEGDETPSGKTFGTGDLDLTLQVNGGPVYIWVRAKNASGSVIERVLFLIATDGDCFEIERLETNGSWSGKLTYDQGLKAYYYGPRDGFPMPGGHDAYSLFKAKATVVGQHTVRVYTIQLPSN